MAYNQHPQPVGDKIVQKQRPSPLHIYYPIMENKHTTNQSLRKIALSNLEGVSLFERMRVSLVFSPICLFFLRCTSKLRVVCDEHNNLIGFSLERFGRPIYKFNFKQIQC